MTHWQHIYNLTTSEENTAANSGIAKIPATEQIFSAFEILLYFSNAAYRKIYAAAEL